MKMKKSVAFVCACAMALSMVSISAYAVDYGNGGSGGSSSGSTGGGTASPIVTPIEDNKEENSGEEKTEEAPKVETVVESKAVNEAIATGESVPVKGDSIVLGKAAVAAILKSETPVSFENQDTGITITIDPAKVQNVGKLDLGMDVQKNDTGLEITPAMTGDFGLTLSVTIPKANIPATVDVNNARLFYVSDEGKVTDLGSIKPNEDGGFTIDITHASSYIISSAAIEDISAGAGLDGTGDVIED